MESKNHKIIRSFLDKKTRNEVIDYVNKINESITLNDHHLKYLVSKLNGNSYMYDISKSDLTNKITSFQSGGYVMNQDLPKVFIELRDKISKELSIPTSHSFLQIVDMDNEGSIERHYDASFKGFIKVTSYKLTDDFICRAATLDELLSDSFISSKQSIRDADLGAKRLAAWCKASSNSDWLLFNKRLKEEFNTFDKN
jgi:hypothetical protein